MRPLLLVFVSSCTIAPEPPRDPDPAPDELTGVSFDEAPPRFRVRDVLSRVAGASSCACATVRVVCVGGPGFARSDESTCTIEMSPATCASLDLANGSSVSPEALLATPIGPITSVDAAYALCALEHEARHTCIDIRATSHCESELQAYATSIACLEAVRSARCEAQHDGFCARLEDFIVAHTAARELNRCLCAEGTTCASCLDACEGAPVTCKEAADAYCAVNGK